MPQRGGSVEHSVREIINFIRASRIVSVRGGLLREGPNGTTIQIDGGKGGVTAGASHCSFGEIVAVSSGGYTQAIRGGAMLCGDKNFNVADRGINLADPAGNGSWLIQITLSGVDPATDDDNEIFLSGVVTASGTPAWGSVAYTGSENYTANTNPSTPAGTGTIVIPIGILTVDSGAATFTPVGCGTITVGQCAGILSHSRG